MVGLGSNSTSLQVVPEKQAKLMLAIAEELGNMSELDKDEAISDQYLRLSTLAMETVQERFGNAQEVSWDGSGLPHSLLRLGIG